MKTTAFAISAALALAFPWAATAAPVGLLELHYGDQQLTQAVRVNEDGSADRQFFNFVTCDGSVREGVACDGSVIPSDSISIVVAASSNPGQTVSVTVTSFSESLGLAIYFLSGFGSTVPAYDLSLQGAYGVACINADGAAIECRGDVTVGALPTTLDLENDLLAGQIEGAFAVRHGSDPIMLLAGASQTSGAITSGGEEMSFGHFVCPVSGCINRASVISFLIDNPSGAYYQVALTSTLTFEPSVIPLPAAGWLLITGIGALAALRRRRNTTAA